MDDLKTRKAVAYSIDALSSNSMKSPNPYSGFHETSVSKCLDTFCCEPTCNQGGIVIVYEGQNASTDTKASFTLLSGRPDDHHIPTVCYFDEERKNEAVENMKLIVLGNTNSNAAILDDETAPTLLGTRGEHGEMPIVLMERGLRKYVIRRLTPMECARLQGFPDWWCDGANGSDSAQYKMWGNGIALPCAADVIGRLAKELDGHEEP